MSNIMNFYDYVHDFPLLYAVIFAVLIPFGIMIAGYLIGLLGEAIALLASLFVDPWLVLNIINSLFFPGVMIHEMSHAFFAIITGAYVKEIALFKRDPETNSLGHVIFYARGNYVIRALQNVFISSAPMYIGAVVTYGAFTAAFGLPYLPTGLRVFAGYIGCAMFYHMTMSPADVKVYMKGVHIFMALVFVVTLILRLVHVL